MKRISALATIINSIGEERLRSYQMNSRHL